MTEDKYIGVLLSLNQLEELSSLLDPESRAGCECTQCSQHNYMYWELGEQANKALNALDNTREENVVLYFRKDVAVQQVDWLFDSELDVELADRINSKIENGEYSTFMDQKNNPRYIGDLWG